MVTVHEKFERLCREGEVSGPADALAIEKAETELGVQFPPEYRAFLERFGAVLAEGVEVYGLPRTEGNDPPLWQDVVSVTKQLRQWEQAGSDRKGFVPICEDGTGVYFYLDTLMSPETKIWAIGPGVDKVVSASFFEFIVDLSNGEISI